MPDDGIEFSLPWRRVMEAQLRRLLRGATVARENPWRDASGCIPVGSASPNGAATRLLLKESLAPFNKLLGY